MLLWRPAWAEQCAGGLDKVVPEISSGPARELELRRPESCICSLYVGVQLRKKFNEESATCRGESWPSRPRTSFTRGCCLSQKGVCCSCVFRWTVRTNLRGADEQMRSGEAGSAECSKDPGVVLVATAMASN